ncbi:hypothetical protein [Persephonella sp.]|nr:hypothetical protein [Aquificota bacterium]
MEQVKQLMIVMDGVDIACLDEEALTELLLEKFGEEGYQPTDRPVVVREGKISSIRAVESDSQEEVEIYAFAKVLRKDDGVRTVITGRVV